MVLPLGLVRGFGPLLDVVEVVGRVAVELDGGRVGAMLTDLAGTVGVVAAAACLFNTSRELRRLVLVVVGRATRERRLVGDRFAIIESFI